MMKMNHGFSQSTFHLYRFIGFDAVAMWPEMSCGTWYTGLLLGWFLFY